MKATVWTFGDLDTDWRDTDRGNDVDLDDIQPEDRSIDDLFWDDYVDEVRSFARDATKGAAA